MSDIDLALMQAQAALTQRRQGTEQALEYLKAVERVLSKDYKPQNLGTVESILKAADTVADAYKMLNAVETGIGELTKVFWETTEVGNLLSKIYVWAYGDRLLTYKQAIHLVFPELPKDKIPAKKYWVMITNNTTIIRDPDEPGRPLLTRYWDISQTYGARLLVDEVIGKLKARKDGTIKKNYNPTAKRNPDRRKPKRVNKAVPA